MNGDELHQLAALVEREQEALLSRWRSQVRQLPSARDLDVATLNDHIPVLLVELSVALKSDSDQTITAALAQGSAPAHGLQRFQEGFDIREVVAEYNVLRGCIHDLADGNGLNLQGRSFHTINRVFDRAIGLALQTYSTRRELELQRRREEYLAFVAHDLRTPLCAISLAVGVLEMTRAEPERDDETGQLWKVLTRSLQQLEGMVKKVLEENANLQTELGTKLVRRRFDLWPLVEGLVHDIQPMATASGTRLINKVPHDLMVHADADLLRRIIQNLVGNAIKYTEGGDVIVGARELEGVVECWVTDNGRGIPEEFLDRIFEKGETDPESEGGMGLGLAIVKTFTEAHGGTVTVESREQVGSTFRFSLPHG